MSFCSQSFCIWNFATGHKGKTLVNMMSMWTRCFHFFCCSSQDFSVPSWNKNMLGLVKRNLVLQWFFSLIATLVVRGKHKPQHRVTIWTVFGSTMYKYECIRLHANCCLPHEIVERTAEVNGRWNRNYFSQGSTEASTAKARRRHRSATTVSLSMLWDVQLGRWSKDGRLHTPNHARGKDLTEESVDMTTLFVLGGKSWQWPAMMAGTGELLWPEGAPSFAENSPGFRASGSTG